MLDTFPQGDAYAIHDTPVVPLGECVRDSITGFLWSYQKASHDLEEGNALGPYLNFLVVADLAAAVAAGTTLFDPLTQANVDKITEAGVPKTSQHKEYAFLNVNNHTGKEQVGYITEIDGSDLTVRWVSPSGRLETALDITSDIVVGAYWLVRKASNAVVVVGVAQQAIAEGKYFWALCEGEGIVKTSAGVLLNNPLAVGSTNGSGAVQTAASLYPAFAYALHTATAAEQIRAGIKVNWVIPQVPVGPAPYLGSDQRPVGGTNPSLIV